MDIEEESGCKMQNPKCQLLIPVQTRWFLLPEPDPDEPGHDLVPQTDPAFQY